MTNGYWWCAECHEEVDCHRVSSQELHDTCGRPVVWVEPQDPVDLLRDQLAALQAENAELLTQHRTERCEATGYDCEELGKLLAALSRVEAERDAAKRDIESILHSCTCEVRHEFCVRSDEPGGCDSDDCHDAKWRGAQGEG